MQMQRNGRIHYIAPEFSGAPCSVQGFTTRHEGVSRPPYNSLNLGTTTLDQSHNVEGNRSLLAGAFGVEADRLVTVSQVHGGDILVIDEPNEDFSHFLGIESDAIITNQPRVMIGVCVADCAPILLLDPEKKVIAAVHAGWKGTAVGITAKAVAGMTAVFGCDPTNIQAAIGPAIYQCCYEVDAPVRQAFSQAGISWDACSQPAGADKWRLNLAAANRELLLKAGVSENSIQDSGMCVCCQKELFFSYRRDNGDTGRQMGFIMLTP